VSREGARGAQGARSAAGTAARRPLSVLLYVALLGLAAGLLLLAVLAVPLAVLPSVRLRPLRFAGFLLLFLLADLTGFAAACWAGLRWAWLPEDRRAQRLEDNSYLLLGRLIGTLLRAAGPLFGLRVVVTPPVPTASGSRPLLLFSRHAGPGDSLLLVHTLLGAAGLRPQLVLKRFLCWDPCLDILVGRIPHCFVPPGPQPDVAALMGGMAAAVRPGEVLAVFPEGGNFTAERYRRAIHWLRRTGQLRRARRAARQRNVLPPRMTGSLAALGGAVEAGADVLFVAHTGLDQLDTPGRMWAGVPLREPVRATWWLVPGTGLPEGQAARREWLDEQWSRVDTWISRERQSGPAVGVREGG
jgi:1-acyl-sn-glycerol-3-phosphate acyltransferase